MGAQIEADAAAKKNKAQGNQGSRKVANVGQQQNASTVVSHFCSKLGEKQYMGGEKISEEDEVVFNSLKDSSQAVKSSGNPNLIRWYDEIKPLMQNNSFNCSFCKDEFATPMIKVMIASSKYSDPLLTCLGC